MKPLTYISLFLAVSLLLTSIAVAETDTSQLPLRKPGLWEMKTLTDGKDDLGKMRQCVDKATELANFKMGKELGEKSCSKNEIRKEGDAYVSETDCTIGKGRSITKSKITGDLINDYHAVMVTKHEPPLNGKSETNVIIDAKRVGPCEPGQKPGAIIFPQS